MNEAVLAERYSRLCVEPSDVVEHLPTFVAAVKELEATRVIELGVRYGVSTIAWLYALQGKGHLWAVDTSFPVPATADAVHLLDPQGPLGVCDHWNFILGHDTSPTVLDLLPKEADIIFIDTNHVYAETLVELELYYPRVRPGGRIFMHDTALEATAGDPQPYPVRTAVEEFCQDKGLVWHNNPSCCGLGTIFC